MVYRCYMHTNLNKKYALNIDMALPEDTPEMEVTNEHIINSAAIELNRLRKENLFIIAQASEGGVEAINIDSISRISINDSDQLES